MADEIVFVGRHDEMLDSGGTFTLPDEWRSGIADGRVVYILPDRSERCLNLMPGAVMEKEIANIRKRAMKDAADLDALKVIGEAMYRVVADDEWCIEIPQRLREMVGLADEVALVGSIRMIKIRSKSALDSVEASDEFAEFLDEVEKEEEHD